MRPSHQGRDDTFANMAQVLDTRVLPGIWADDVGAHRASRVQVETDIPCGDLPREVKDIVWPDATPKGQVGFVHNGF